jgi:hypothetical protein
MGAVTVLESWEVGPNPAIKKVVFQTPNTADENNTFDVTLSDHGISATGLLTIRSWVHTTSGSVIVTDIATCSVTAGVATITVQSANNNAVRVVELMGRSDLGVFA